MPETLTEELMTRDEHSRSLEDAERYRALHTLQELGLLIPLSDVESYHGRLAKADETEEWEVNPTFSNAKNDTGNSNVNARPTLYTSEKDIARDFALERGRDTAWSEYIGPFKAKVRNYSPEERAQWLQRLNEGRQTPFDERALGDSLYISTEAHRLEGEMPEEERAALKNEISSKYRPEIHDIVSTDPDAMVLDLSFDDTKLSEEDKKRYETALDALAIRVTAGSPLEFEARYKSGPFRTAINELKKHVVADEDVAEIAELASLDMETALQLASGYNSWRIAHTRPSYLADQILEHDADIVVAEIQVGGEKQKVPINLEYAARYMREAHIVGVRQGVSSATLGRDIKSISLFDLEKIGTSGQVERQRDKTFKKLGALAGGLAGIPHIESVRNEQPLLATLSDVHSKPKTLVEAAKKVEGFESTFNADAGNWEGFTLAEHTETVLRNFDENFADEVPVEYIVPMRLAILSHDLGKPFARMNGERDKEKQFNAERAANFMDKLGTPDSLKELILAVVGDGQELAFQVWIRKAGQPAEDAMDALARQTLSEFYKSEQIDDSQISGFKEMCKMLLVCDGGAYTSMAITDNQEEATYRNAPSFNHSFAQPIGLGRRGLRLREGGEEGASPDLAPREKEELSRVRFSRAGAGRRPPQL